MNEEETRRCTKCKQLFPETDEYFYRSHYTRADGTNGFRHVCRNCVAKEYEEHKSDRIAYNAMYMRNKRARAAGARETVTRVEWESVLAEFNNECAYCGADGMPFGLGMDHIVPLALGGRHTVGNIVPACRSCNSRKHTSQSVAWYHKQPFYTTEREQKILSHMEEKQ